MLLRKYSLAVILLCLTGCSGSGDKPAAKERNAVLECSHGGGELTSSECARLAQTSLGDAFFSEVRKIKKVNSGIYTLSGVVGETPESLSVIKNDLNHSDYERGVITVVRDNELQWTFSRDTLSIMDMDVTSNGEVIVIAVERSQLPHWRYVVLQISPKGELESEYSLSDSAQTKDECINLNMDFMFGECDELDSKSDPALVAMAVYHHKYSFAKIAWGKNTNHFYTVIDKGRRETTVLYRWDIKAKEASLAWRRPLLKGSKAAAGMVNGLMSGSERFALNRYGYFYEKQLVVSDAGDLYVGINMFINSNAALTEFLPEAEEKALAEEHSWQHFVVKMSPQGKIEWVRSMRGVEQDRPLTALVVSQEVVFAVAHGLGPSGQQESYKVTLAQLDQATGNVLMMPKIMGLPGNSFAVGAFAVSRDEVVFSGLTGFVQNPAGMSLGNYGQAFIAKYNVADERLQLFKYRESLRKDMARAVWVEGDELYVGADSSGPITHSADNNILEAYQKSAVSTWDIKHVFPF